MFYFAFLPLAVLAAAFAFTRWQVRAIERAHPNVGERTDIGGYSLNSVDVSAPAGADLPPIVFIHGASGNLNDQMHAFRPVLEGRARLLFVDRPGYGYSDRGGPENDTPAGQADGIAALMERKGISRAIIVGHSLGAAIAASFALRHPEKTIGILFLAPATHPWPGGVDWYYNLAAAPLVGPLFRHTLLLPAGLRRIESGTDAVFAPDPKPDDYVARTAPRLILRPASFHANARDVSRLNAYLKRIQPQYGKIAAPAVIITGNRDAVVAEEIHSLGLERDLKNSEIVWLEGVGHKPDYVATDVAVAAIERLARSEPGPA